MKKLINTLSGLCLLSCGFVANAGLIDRGNGMIYDDVLDITWLQDANYAGTTNAFSNFGYDGHGTWEQANTWVDSLVYGGFSDWRLANVYDVNNDLCVDNSPFSNSVECGYGVSPSYTDVNGNTFYHEIAYMFFENLGNVAYPNSGWNSINSSFTDSETGNLLSFDNLIKGVYWSGEEFTAPDGNVYGWRFETDGGNQRPLFAANHGYVWAVRDGDVAQTSLPNEVPEPSSVAIFAAGIIGLMYRRKERALSA